MFRFNFKIDLSDENDAKNGFEENVVAVADNSEEEIKYNPVTTHTITDDHLMNVRNINVDKIKERLWKDQRKLKFVHDELQHTIKDLSPSSQVHSDLIPAVYEGGFKIWECTWDLLEYIKEKEIVFKNKRVLDLGCGSGIVGIVSSIEGASHVVFQDYNEEVIEEWTIPNVILNLENRNDSPESLSVLKSKCSFYSGDWDDFSLNSDLQREKFDLIVTSETIYNASNYRKLVHVFDRCLKPSGVVLLAAKNYYFGVGGGTLEFTKFLCQNDFQVSSLVCHTEGVQREILTINKVKP